MRGIELNYPWIINSHRFPMSPSINAQQIVSIMVYSIYFALKENEAQEPSMIT